MHTAVQLHTIKCNNNNNIILLSMYVHYNIIYSVYRPSQIIVCVLVYNIAVSYFEFLIIIIV